MIDVRQCVYCRERPVEFRWRPFCSERCRMADLGRWLSGHYRVPAAEPSDASDEAGPPDASGASYAARRAPDVS